MNHKDRLNRFGRSSEDAEVLALLAHRRAKLRCIAPVEAPLRQARARQTFAGRPGCVNENGLRRPIRPAEPGASFGWRVSAPRADAGFADMQVDVEDSGSADGEPMGDGGSDAMLDGAVGGWSGSSCNAPRPLPPRGAMLAAPGGSRA
jgi:hypothetical protein